MSGAPSDVEDIVHITPIDLSFTDATGRTRVLHAVTGDGKGWYVQASLDGRMFTKHCSDWHRVERTLNWLRAHAHESTPAVRHAAPMQSLVAGLAAMILILGVATGSAQVAATEAEAVEQFQAAVNNYAFLHRRLEQNLAPIEVTANPETIRKAIEAMAAAVRAARPDAQQGDLFTPALQGVLRIRIAKALREHFYTTADVHAEEMAEGIDPREATLKVNGSFPWTVATAMFPCIVAALPALPPELQYRIVGHSLVLIDVHASLIVDLLPFAIANGETTRHLLGLC